jgi:hypothetical protein
VSGRVQKTRRSSSLPFDTSSFGEPFGTLSPEEVHNLPPANLQTLVYTSRHQGVIPPNAYRLDLQIALNECFEAINEKTKEHEKFVKAQMAAVKKLVETMNVPIHVNYWECPICKTLFPMTDQCFHRDGKAYFGFSEICKDCRKRKREVKRRRRM